jgi:hypothetical protein
LLLERKEPVYNTAYLLKAGAERLDGAESPELIPAVFGQFTSQTESSENLIVKEVMKAKVDEQEDEFHS